MPGDSDEFVVGRISIGKDMPTQKETKMTATVDQIYQDATRLNEIDRAGLVDRLIDTLEPSPFDDELKKTI